MTAAEQEQEDDGAVAAEATAGIQSLSLEGEQEEEQEEQEPEPVPEPEECAICLGDLSAADEEGGVLLACSHVFHANCLERWKAKCLEKGLRFTCAICRGAVIVST